jgi:hypothetical protein
MEKLEINFGIFYDKGARRILLGCLDGDSTSDVRRLAMIRLTGAKLKVLIPIHPNTRTRRHAFSWKASVFPALKTRERHLPEMTFFVFYFFLLSLKPSSRR